MQKMVRKKTWSRSNLTLVCGKCTICERELLSNEGGWIINAEKKYFCHEGRDGSCFDQYCKQGVNNVRKENEEAYG